jgi:hypothetical protein
VLGEHRVSAARVLQRRRNYAGLVRSVLAELRAGKNTRLPAFLGQPKSDDEQRRVYAVFDANVGRIGTLGPETARRIATFYTQLLGLAASMRGWSMEDRERPVEKKIGVLEQELSLWGSAERLGKELVAELGRG